MNKKFKEKLIERALWHGYETYRLDSHGDVVLFEIWELNAYRDSVFYVELQSLAAKYGYNVFGISKIETEVKATAFFIGKDKSIPKGEIDVSRDTNPGVRIIL